MGYEAYDIPFNIERHKLAEDEEYKKIDKEWEDKIKDFIEERKAENEKMRARAEELKAEKKLKIL
jgi:HSP90 family molecular chaperone